MVVSGAGEVDDGVDRGVEKGVGEIWIWGVGVVEDVAVVESGEGLGDDFWTLGVRETRVTPDKNTIAERMMTMNLAMQSYCSLIV